MPSPVLPSLGQDGLYVIAAATDLIWIIRAGTIASYCSGTCTVSPGVWIDRLSSLVEKRDPGV